MLYNRLRFWRTVFTPPPLALGGEILLSVVLHLLQWEFPLQLCLLEMALYQYLGPLLTFILQTMKNRSQTDTIVMVLFGVCVKHSWMSSGDMPVSALSLRLYRKRLWWGILVRMRQSWWQDWVGSFNSTAAKWFWGPASPLFGNRIYLTQGFLHWLQSWGREAAPELYAELHFLKS